MTQCLIILQKKKNLKAKFLNLSCKKAGLMGVCTEVFYLVKFGVKRGAKYHLILPKKVVNSLQRVTLSCQKYRIKWHSFD